MINSFDYFSTLRDNLDNEASSLICYAWRRYKVNCNVEMRRAERTEKERIKDIANKAKAVSMRRKYQTSNYSSYAINGDSSIPVVPLNKVSNLDLSLKLSKGQSAFPTNQKRASSSAFGLAIQKCKNPLQKMETENSYSFNDIDDDKYIKELEDELNYDLSPARNSSSCNKMESIAEADSD